MAQAEVLSAAGIQGVSSMVDNKVWSSVAGDLGFVFQSFQFGSTLDFFQGCVNNRWGYPL